MYVVAAEMQIGHFKLLGS